MNAMGKQICRKSALTHQIYQSMFAEESPSFTSIHYKQPSLSTTLNHDEHKPLSVSHSPLLITIKYHHNVSIVMACLTTSINHHYPHDSPSFDHHQPSLASMNHREPSTNHQPIIN